MCDFISISDWIHVSAITVSTIISIISIVIAVISLKTTKKSIEDSNKPYLACYIDTIEVGHFNKYFIIKNFGRTPAKILDIQFSKLIEGLGINGKIDSLKDSVIAPNQKAITAMGVKGERFSVTLTYQDMQGQVSTQTYDLNSGFSEDLVYVEENASNLTDDTNRIINAIHDYTKRNL